MKNAMDIINGLFANEGMNGFVDVKGMQQSIKNIVPVSQEQINLYLKLCEQKGVDIEPDYKDWDGSRGGKMSKAIKNLMSMADFRGASEGQITMLKNICERNGWEVPDYSKLSGGREGEMSALISKLIDLEKKTRAVQPLTEAQLNIIIDMYYCPDVMLEDLDERFGNIIISEENGKMYWTRISIEKLMEVLPSTVTAEQANEFINKYKGEFYDWKNTRLTPSQIDRIQELQKRCSMEPQPAHDLIQFDKRQANSYINKLEAVLRDKNITKFSPVEFEMWYGEGLLSKAHVINAYDEKNETTMYDNGKIKFNAKVNGVAKSLDSSMVSTIEEQKVINLIHTLYATMGMSANEDSEDVLDSTYRDSALEDLIRVAMDYMSEDNMVDLLREIYTDEEITAITGIQFETDEVVEERELEGMDLDDYEMLPLGKEQEFSEEEKNIIQAIDVLNSIEDSITKKHIKNKIVKQLNQYNDLALITEEFYEEYSNILKATV